MTSLDGRTALVTGAAAGLGRAQAMALARAGANVVIFDLGNHEPEAEPGYPLAGEAQLAETVKALEAAGANAIGFAGDVRNQQSLNDAVEAAAATFGRLDVVVANAGIAIQSPTWLMSTQEWELTIDVNLTGVWQTCRAAIPRMIDQQYGRIIAISSINAWKVMAGLGAYGAAKAGVISLMRVLAIELAEHGITANAICPSTVPAGTGRGVAARAGIQPEEFYEHARLSQPMKRLLEPEDVARAVLFFASDEARNFSGVSLTADGALTVA